MDDNIKADITIKNTSKVLHLDHSFIGCCNLDTSESRLEIPGKF
jgi:hypothetical protein